MSCGCSVEEMEDRSVPGKRLALPQVTLCAATSVNVKATMHALEACLMQIDFAACKLFTDALVRPEHPNIEVVPIGRLSSSSAYSDFLLSRMVDHVATSHCLVVQWDGYVLDAERWLPDFLDYDYIGARWPQFDDGHDVGNGGFSLRSRRLMEACREPEFRGEYAEDVAIGRTNRDWLEGRGMRFAPAALADLFSAERTGNIAISFGYHGVFNMPRVVGSKRFLDIYQDLDEISAIRHDFFKILKYVMHGNGGFLRSIKLIIGGLNIFFDQKKIN